MRFALFYHSVRSDWNHGNAHFLRGIMRALQALGHDAVCYEEAENWSISNLVGQHGLQPLVQFHRRFPFAQARLYRPAPVSTLEKRLRRELADVDVVIVHEWTAVENPTLVELLARLKRTHGFLLFFHDTHYRILTQPVRMARLGFDRFDAILAYGPSIADEYRRRFGLTNVHVFHEAADASIFHPMLPDPDRPMDDALFIGNWGGRDRAHELREFLLRPARHFRRERRFAVHGVRYPAEVLDTIQRYYGVEYRGWLPNYLVPAAFAQAHVVVHVIRRQYMRALHGIPTIRVFEALACGTALVSTRWHDTDGLFREGEDYVVVDNRAQMQEALQWLWTDVDARERLGRNGLRRVLEHHTCVHRAEQLLGIAARLRAPAILQESHPDAEVRALPRIEMVPALVSSNGNGAAHLNGERTAVNGASGAGRKKSVNGATGAGYTKAKAS